MTEAQDEAIGTIVAAAREAVEKLAAEHGKQIEVLMEEQAAVSEDYRLRIAAALGQVTQLESALASTNALNAQKLASLQDALQKAYAELADYVKRHPDTYRLGGRKAWAIHQIAQKSDLSSVATMLADAKATVPAIGGFGLRMGWKQYAADKSVLDRAKEVADSLGLEFSFRFMAGRHTPLEAMGYSATLDGDPIPLPFLPDGSPNLEFENAWCDLVNELADWYQENDCHLLHLSWYAGKWAELYHGPEVRNAQGYSEPTSTSPGSFLAGHSRLIALAGDLMLGRPIVVEFPATGHGPLPLISAGLNKTAWAVFGDSRRFVLQLNGWSDAGIVGAPNMSTATALLDAVAEPKVLKAVQAIQPWGGGKTYPQLSATQVAAALAKADSVSSQYLEVYLPSFLSKNGGAVWAKPLETWLAAQ